MDSFIFVALVAIALMAGLLNVARHDGLKGDVRIARLNRARRIAGIDRTRESAIILELKRLGEVATPVELPSFLLRDFVEDLSILAVALMHGLVSTAKATAKATRLSALWAVESFTQTSKLIVEAIVDATRSAAPVVAFVDATLVTLGNGFLEILATVGNAIVDAVALALWAIVAVTRKVTTVVRVYGLTAIVYLRYRIAKAQTEAQVRRAERALHATVKRMEKTQAASHALQAQVQATIEIAELRAELRIVQAGIQAELDEIMAEYERDYNVAVSKALGDPIKSPKSRKSQRPESAQGSNQVEVLEVASTASEPSNSASLSGSSPLTTKEVAPERGGDLV